jgi:hypothetical protein
MQRCLHRALITLCKIAYCTPECQRAGLCFAGNLYDVAHIHENSPQHVGPRECSSTSTRGTQSAASARDAVSLD